MTPRLTTSERERLEELFDQLATMPASERQAFAERECADDAPMLQELRRLMRGLDGDDLLADLAPTAPLAPGVRIGAYELAERVGEGGMGEVYAAHQREPVARRVALKLIKLGMDSAQVTARFEAERQALARMQHPNIAQVYDGGTTADGRPFFVMEFVAGVPITDYCNRGCLTTRRRLELFLGVCAGVQHAHLKGIIHRDLKPSNVLVAEHDGTAAAKIIDFGVARAITGRLGERTLHTVLGQIVGTLDYMSPEQADPSAVDIDTRSDVYSLGVVLYQLVSGFLPFEPTSVELPLSEVQRVIRDQDPPTPSTQLRRQTGTAERLASQHGTDGRSLIRQLAGDLDWICLKALAKDPARRYQSVAELADDLRRHLRNEPVSAGRPSAAYRLRKFVRRHRAGVVVSVMTAALVVIGFLGLLSLRTTQANRPYVASYRLGELMRRADLLWPIRAESISELEAWQRDMRGLGDYLADHRAELAALDAGALESEAARSRQQTLSQLVEDLTVLAEDATGFLGERDGSGFAHGWSVTRRLAEARRLERGFMAGGEFSKAWTRWLPAIHEAYPGLRLQVQRDLLPLGPDPATGFHEFAHLISGEPAARDELGKLQLLDDTGVVLVLLPGGTFSMGALGEFERFRGNQVQPDSGANGREGPVLPVEVAPFFMSKFEMTQAQWQRFVGHNPSLSQRGMVEPAPRNPINQVTWTECDRVTRRMGLLLPSEQQWEYAARAGTTTAWWTGDDAAELRKVDNLRGMADGWRVIAPVDTFPPNPFGLHSVHGNVTEWCCNHPWTYGTEPGSDPETLRLQAARGGNTRMQPGMGRSASRLNGRRDFEDPALGLRPCRAIDGVP